MSYLGMITVVVPDYDEAIEYYTNILDFELIEDTVRSPEKRWVIVAPNKDRGAALLLAKAATPEQVESVGNSTAGRVAFFLYTQNFDDDYEKFLARGVDFIDQPRNEEYGKVIVFRDLYGNKWDFIERD